jgi:hypothetical protein
MSKIVDQATISARNSWIWAGGIDTLTGIAAELNRQQ